MILMLRMALLFSFATIAFAQAPPQKIGMGSISGKVMMDGKPAANALVILGKNEQVSPAQATAPPRTTMDSSGVYRFNGLPAGKYIVNVAAQGYVNTKRGSEGEETSSITMADGEKLEAIGFTLVKAGVIAGRVTDEQGRPVINYPLALYRVEEGGKKIFVPCSRNTDDRGIYRCFNLPPGNYLIGAGKDNKQKEDDGEDSYGGGRDLYARSWYPNTPDKEKAKVLKVSAGGELLEIDLKLGRRKKGATVTGRVLATDTNQPVSRAQVVYGRVNEGGEMVGLNASTDSQANADGEFRILGLQPGKYKLTPVAYACI